MHADIESKHKLELSQFLMALKSANMKLAQGENTITELVENKQLLESLVNELNNKCAEY